MLPPPGWRVLGAEEISAAQHWEILDDLFRATPTLVAACAIGIIALFSWLNDVDAAWLPQALALDVAVAGARLALTRAYRARSVRDSPQQWERRFLVATLVSGLQWGLSLATIYVQAGTDTKVCALACACGLISGAVSRTNIFPAATIVQVVPAMALIAAPVFASGQWAFGVVIVIFTAMQMLVGRHLSIPRLRLLLAETEREQLLGLLRAANAGLADANTQLQKRVLTDGLTGVANRRHFDQCLSELAASPAWHSEPHALVMIDVDRFKAFNDTHGHQAGDRCLTLVARAAAACVVEPGHVLARYGGEEFAVILPATSRVAAEALAERMRLAVAGVRLATRTGDVSPTASFGIACTTPGGRDDALSLLEQADRALYRAKQAGRDCLRSAGVDSAFLALG